MSPSRFVTLVAEDRQFFKSAKGLPEPWQSQRESPLSHSFCQHTIEGDKPLIIEDARTHPLVRDNLAIRDMGVVAYAGVPLQTPDGHTIGSLCAFDTVPRAWTETEITLLTHLAALVMREVAFHTLTQHADSLTRRATHDVLTDLPNRAMFAERLAAILAYGPAWNTVAVLFLDIDGFKEINDRYGHAVGDQMLVSVANRLQRGVRPSDLVARHSGDEFTVLLTSLWDASEVEGIVQRLLRDLHTPYELQGQPVTLTVSIGVAYNVTAYDEPADLLREADAAMYRAKQRGKAQYALPDDAPQPPSSSGSTA